MAPFSRVPRSPSRRQRLAGAASGLHGPHGLPPVHVTSRDYRRLRSLSAAERRTVDETVLRFLADELDRATVHAPHKVPADAVTLRSRVVFRSDIDEDPECRVLVYDEPHAVIGGTVSVLTPLGAALLGLRAGSAMPYRGPDGHLRTASVEGVAYQPEDQERRLRRTHLSNPYADGGESRPVRAVEARAAMPENHGHGPDTMRPMAPS
jgi:regulator of nucleoside diphosphate kinase